MPNSYLSTHNGETIDSAVDIALLLPTLDSSNINKIVTCATNAFIAVAPDSTLSIEGAAADAQATGNEIEKLKDSTLLQVEFAPLLAVGQSIDGGNTTSNNKRARTGLLQGGSAIAAIELTGDVYTCFVAEYGSGSSINSSNYVGRIIPMGSSGFLPIPPTAAQIVIVFSRVDGGNMDLSDASVIRSYLSAYARSDSSLTLANYAADAKLTGDSINSTNQVVGDMTNNTYPTIRDISSVYTERRYIDDNGNFVVSESNAVLGRITVRVNSVFKCTDPTYEFRATFFNESNEKIGSVGYSNIHNNTIFINANDVPRIAFTFRRKDQIVLTSEDKTAIIAATEFRETNYITRSTVDNNYTTFVSEADNSYNLYSTLGPLTAQYIDYSDGTRSGSNKYVYLGGYPFTNRFAFVRCDSSVYEFRLHYYATQDDSYSNNYLGYTSFSSLINNTIFFDGDVYPFVRVLIARKDRADLTTTDKEAILSSIKVGYRYKDLYINDVIHFTNLRNNTSNVNEFLGIAQTYLNRTNMSYGDGLTVLYTQTSYYIDCSTFAILCMMGLDYDHTPYGTGIKVPPSEITVSPDYGWATSPTNHTISRFSTNASSSASVRLACQLGRWLYESGRAVHLDNGFEDVQPGDLVFWARKEQNGTWHNPNWWKHISHVGIVLSKEPAPDTYQYTDDSTIYDWDKEKYPYKHQIIEVNSSVPCPCVNNKWLEYNQEDPTIMTRSNVNTIALIARPDLGALSQSAQKEVLSDYIAPSSSTPTDDVNTSDNIDMALQKLMYRILRLERQVADYHNN